MISYLTYLTIFLAVIFPVIYIIRRKPDLSFWFLVNVYFDPGGYFAFYLEDKTIFGLNLSDFSVLLIIFCLYAVNANYKIIYNDRFLLKFFKVFFIFALYFFVFYGGIVPYLHNDFNYVLFLQKNRNFLYSVIIFISVYIFTMRGLKYLYLTTLFLGVIILGAFSMTLITGLNIIPVEVFERYSGSEMMRITILSWGLFQILFPLAYIIFMFSGKVKLNLEYRKLVYITGMLMVITLLITLTRRNIISIPGTIIIISLLSSNIFRKSKLFSFVKILAPVSIVLLILYLILPKYVDYVVNISQDTFQLLTKGKDTRGEKEYRVSGTGDLEITKKYIRDNILLGTGYTYLYWGESEFATSPRGHKFAMASDAAQEVPVYNILFGYGVAGLIIMAFLYSFLIRLFLRLYKLLRKYIKLFTPYPYELLFAFLIMYMMADRFTFSIYSLGTDFTSTYYGIFIGMGFALLRKLKLIALNAEKNLISDV